MNTTIQQKTNSSDSLLEELLDSNTKRQEIIELIYYATHFWDGDYNWYQNKCYRRGMQPREILTDEEWVEKHLEKLAKENKVAVLEKFMEEDEFYKLIEEEDLDY